MLVIYYRVLSVPSNGKVKFVLKLKKQVREYWGDALLLVWIIGDVKDRVRGREERNKEEVNRKRQVK